MMRLVVEAEINPSEDPEKVSEAVKNIFPELEVEVSKDLARGESDRLESLENLKDKLGLQAIRDSARNKLKRGRDGNSVRFFLNKQAATVDKVSFSGKETPLGPIEVRIESDNMNELIDYISPGREERKI